MAKRLLLHIGPHKTGTTSVQTYFGQNATALKNQGLHVCHDAILADTGQLTFQPRTNCYGIAHHLIRRSLITPVRVTRPAFNPPSEVRADLIRSFNAWATSLEAEALFVSSEAFSFLRTGDELADLKALTRGLAVTPIAVLRKPEDWMRSWRAQLAKRKVLVPSSGNYDDTIFDFRETSWLTDHSALRRFFGPDGVYLNYETAMERDRSVIPSMLAAVGVSTAGLTDPGQVWLNRSTP